jgi:hypothetical protein
MDAVPIVEQAVREATARHQVASSSQVLLLLAEVYLLADCLPEAAEAAGRALERFRRQRALGQAARALRLLGDIDGRRDGADRVRAESRYAEASAVADALGMLPLRAHCDAGRGRFLMGAGDLDGARQALESACARFRQLGMITDLARAEAELKAVS